MFSNNVDKDFVPEPIRAFGQQGAQRYLSLGKPCQAKMNDQYE